MTCGVCGGTGRTWKSVWTKDYDPRTGEYLGDSMTAVVEWCAACGGTGRAR